MRIYPLSTEERIPTGFTHKAIVTYADFTTAGTTQALTLATLTAGQFVNKVGHRLVTDFLSANGTGITVSVGNASSVTAYSATKELQATEIDYWQAASATPPAGAPDQTGETELLKANFITSGGTTPLLTEYTAGEVHIYFGITDLNLI